MSLADETVTDARAFAQHLLTRLSKRAAEMSIMSAEQRRELLGRAGDELSLGERTTTYRAGGSVNAWLLQGELAREVSDAFAPASVERPAADVFDLLDDLLDLVRSYGFEPVIVVDDSDRWLTTELGDRSHLVEAFFGTVLRTLAERRTSLVVAVHHLYLEKYDLDALSQDTLEIKVEVPSLSVSAHLAEILDRRIEHVSLGEVGRGAREAFSPPALDRLGAVHAGPTRRNLRATLRVAQDALAEAIRRADEEISPELVEAVSPGTA